MANAPLSDEDRENLVAYLDGELDEASARELETKIHVDPVWRAEAERLKRTWDLLEYLPRPQPSPSFTHRTLERIERQPAGPRTTAPMRRRWPRAWLFGAGWAAAVLLCGVGGYTAATYLGPGARAGDEEALRRDLRVIENRRLYELADDVEFLEQLNRPELFGDDPPES